MDYNGLFLSRETILIDQIPRALGAGANRKAKQASLLARPFFLTIMRFSLSKLNCRRLKAFSCVDAWILLFSRLSNFTWFRLKRIQAFSCVSFRIILLRLSNFTWLSIETNSTYKTSFVILLKFFWRIFTIESEKYCHFEVKVKNMLFLRQFFFFFCGLENANRPKFPIFSISNSLWCRLRVKCSLYLDNRVFRHFINQSELSQARNQFHIFLVSILIG